MGTLVQALAEQAEVHVLCFRRSEESVSVDPRLGIRTLEALPLVDRSCLHGVSLGGHLLRMAWLWGFRGLPLVAAKHHQRAMYGRIQARILDLRPDAVLVEFAVMSQYVPAIHGVPAVMTDHERGDALPARFGPFEFGVRRDRRLWRQHIVRCYRHARLVQALNREDAAELAQRLGMEVGVRPAAVPLPARPVAVEQTPPRALFLGDFSHHPNPQAAEYLLREVLPLLRQRLPDCELALAGPRLPASFAQKATAAGARVLGFVPDLTRLLGQSRLLLAPLFEGGGSRIKVLTAMAHGLPVVSNALGLRGIDAPAPAVFRAETAAQLAEAAIACLADRALAARSGSAARVWVEQHSSPRAAADAQLAALEGLVAGR
jgi:glycosyltransferase involved in cell wall biosynthesis